MAWNLHLQVWKYSYINPLPPKKRLKKCILGRLKRMRSCHRERYADTHPLPPLLQKWANLFFCLPKDTQCSEMYAK